MRPVDPSTLGVFRIAFGIFLTWWPCRHFFNNAYPLRVKYIVPPFHFSYEWFPWITALPGKGMYYFFALMGLAGLFLALGLFYRVSAFVFFITYTYAFLIDKVEYNNHYYFICLLGFLFCFINADRWMSLDKWRKPSLPDTIPYWNLLIFQAQVFLVYFFGGISKINLDWFGGEPMRHWLIEPADRVGTPQLVTTFLKHELAPYFFSYTGFIFDLVIGFLLICKRTRLLAIGLLLIFNLTNDWLFNIGIFPFLMIGATVLFLEPNTPRKWLNNIISKRKEQKLVPGECPAQYQKPAVLFFSFYLALQVLLPFRHWLYEGKVSWTEEGHRFSWRMKIRSKENCQVNFIATNPQTDNTWVIFPEGNLRYRQFRKMCKHPHMIFQYANFLGKQLEAQGIQDPIIKINSLVSLNFRPRQRMIDPDVNILKEEYSTFSHAKWILPLKE
jgi:vitamin K-dependent gamma-carboxylase